MPSLALRYAAAGFSVFPCDPVTKQPCTPNGFHDRTTNVALATERWGRWPHAMIGAVPGDFGAILLDVDEPRHIASLAGLGITRDSACVIETPGGEHWLFLSGALPPGHSVKLEGVVTRHTAGYAIMPGSVRADGRRYVARGRLADLQPLSARFVDAYLAHVAKMTAAPAAPAILPLAVDGDRRERRVDAYLATIGHAPEGERNNTTYRVAAALLRDFGLTELDAWSRLVQWNAGHCHPPLAGRELRACFHSAGKHAQRAVGAAFALDPVAPQRPIGRVRPAKWRQALAVAAGGSRR